MGGWKSLCGGASRHELKSNTWFCYCRLLRSSLCANPGVSVPALEREFSRAMVQPSLQTAARLVDDGLLARDGDSIRLTPRGRLLSNDVFQEFLAPASREGAVTREKC